MLRWSAAGLILASLTAQPVLAGDVPQFVHAKAPTDNHCAALGEGFFAVAGSNACMKISGRISAGVGFARPGPAGVFGSRVAPLASGFNTETAVTGDIRFDTEAGPGRIYVHVQSDTNPRWRGGDDQ
jgi:hypothetical protein